MVKQLAILTLCLMLGGCVSTQFALVDNGRVAVNDLSLATNDLGWNKAPQIVTGYLHPNSELWTRDGILLDRLYIISGVENGGTLFKSASDDLVYPEFRQGMLPNEIVELLEGSFGKLLGPETLIESSGLRPHRLGDQRAVMVDISLTASEQPTFNGRALAFVANDKLYVVTFMATEIHYFDKHWQEAEAVLNSVRLAAESEAA